MTDLHEVAVKVFEALKAKGADLGNMSVFIIEGVLKESGYVKTPEVAEPGVVSNPGYDSLWGWFGLSYASYLVLPRVFMHAMPDDWQKQMANLLEYWDEYWNFYGSGVEETRVQIVDKQRRFVKTPEWLISYRHPDFAKIDSLRVKKPSC